MSSSLCVVLPFVGREALEIKNPSVCEVAKVLLRSVKPWRMEGRKEEGKIKTENHDPITLQGTRIIN
jgi:hypothetical protein